MDERDALLQYIVNIDEDASASIINQQLTEVVNRLQDLRVSIQVDPSTVERLYSQLDDVMNRINLTRGGIDFNSVFNQLGSEQQAVIQRTIESYNALGFAISRITTDAEGELVSFTGTIRDVGGAMQTLRFDADGAETGQTFTGNILKEIDKYLATARKAEEGLARLQKKMVDGDPTPSTIAKARELETAIEQSYAAASNAVVNSKQVTEAYQEILLKEIGLHVANGRSAVTAAEAVARADHEKTLEIERLNKAAKDYEKTLRELKEAEATSSGNTLKENLREQMNSLKQILVESGRYEQKLAEIDERVEKAFNVDQLKKAEREYGALNDEVLALGTQLRNTQDKLSEAEFKGRNEDVINYTEKMTQLNSEMSRVAERATELESLLKIDSDGAVLREVENQRRLADEMREAANIASRLDEKFGKVVQTFADGSKIDNVSQSTEGLTKNLEEYGQKLLGTNVIVRKYDKEHSNHEQMTRKVTYAVKDADGVYRLYTYTLDKATDQLRLTSVEIDTASKKIVGFKNQIVEAAKKIATWGVSTKLVYGTWRAFQDGIEVVKELDKELTQIAVVQGVTRDSTKSLGEQYAQTAVEMAQTVQDVAKLNTELVRQGLSLEESAKRTDVIMKLSAAGMVSMEQALQTVTTGVNAMGVAQEKVADVILKASMLSASNVEGLGEAFSKTASGAKAAGLSIEETSALLAVMKDVTQEGDSQLGTSLKSMLARFNKINEETGNLNEDLNEVQTAIESVGVRFTDADGQIRSFYDIAEDLSELWPTLDKNTKAYIATQAAGVRQQNRFFALMGDFNRVQAINNDLTYAAGTLQQSYATYLTSSEAASKRLQASIQQLWVNFIDSDDIIQLTELATGLINIIDKVGVLNVAVGLLSAKFLIFNDFFKQSFMEVFKVALNEATKNVIELGTAQATSATMGGIYSGMVNSTTGSLLSMKVAALAAGKALIAVFPHVAIAAAVGAAITGLIKLISDYTAKQREAKRELEELDSSVREMVSNQATTKLGIETDFKSLEDYRSRLSELTSQELQAYYELNNKLIEQFPEIETQYDAYGNKIVATTVKLQDLNDAQKAIEKEKLTEYLNNLDEIEQQKKVTIMDAENIRESIRLIEQLTFEIENLQAMPRYKNDTKSQELVAQKEQEIKDTAVKLRAGYAKLGEEVIEGYRIQAIAAGQEIPLILLNALNSPEVQSSLGELVAGGKTFEQAFKQSAEVRKLAEGYYSLSMQVGNTQYKITDFDADLKTLNQSYRDGFISVDEYVKELSGINEATSKLGSGHEELATALRQQIALYLDDALAKQAQMSSEEELLALRQENIELAKQDYDESTKKAQGYYDALEQLNNAKISDVEIQNMILDKHPEFIALMGDRVALTKAVEQAMLDEEQVRLETYMNMLLNTNEFLTSSSSGYAEYVAALGTYYKGDITNYAQLEQSKATFTQNLIAELVKSWGEYFKVVDGAISFNKKAMQTDLSFKLQTGELTPEQARRALEQADRAYKNAQASLDRVNTSFDNLVNGVKLTLPSVKDINKAMDKTASSGKSAAKGVDAAKKALEEYNKEMKATQDATKEVFDFALEYINWIEEQKREEIEKTKDAAIEAAESAYDTEIELIDKALEQQEEILDAKEAALKTEEETYEYQKKRLELQDSLVNLEYKLALASLDTSVSGAARRKTLMESLAEEQENLDELERDRKQTLQEEWFARQRAFIQNQAEIERAQAEATKTAKIEKAEQEYAQKNLKLDQYYSAELNYLAAVEATQSGMIENLNGKMIPLKEAFKELAIENERFWTFFGQQEVEEFGNTVTTVMEAIKKLGFETIQTWKEVATAATNASNAASAASVAESGGVSSPSISSGNGGPTGPSQSDLNKSFQRWAETQYKKLVSSQMPRGWGIDGTIGPATKTVVSELMKKNSDSNSAMEKNLATVLNGGKITQMLLDQFLNGQIRATVGSATQTTSGSHRAFAEGGKIDYTGPAQVHGSKSKPEYVFNYQQFKDLSKMIARHELTSVKKPTAITKPVEIKFDNLITVQGSVDKTVIDDVKRASTDAIDRLANQLRGWGK